MPERLVKGRAFTLRADSRKLTTGLMGRLRATFRAKVGSLLTLCIWSRLPSVATVRARRLASVAAAGAVSASTPLLHASATAMYTIARATLKVLESIACARITGTWSVAHLASS